ncbi:MAG: hypothetical protein NVSMB64_19180 [Candidatus Velthaea sp.]
MPERFDMADLRSRYDDLGTAKVFFGVAVVGTILGALMPTVRTPTVIFFSAGNDLRFYNLGLGGWLVFIALAALAVAPFVRPLLTAGRRAIGLLAIAGALVGVMITLLAVSSYGLIGAGPGVYAWLIAAGVLVAGYFRRTGIER